MASARNGGADGRGPGAVLPGHRLRASGRDPAGDGRRRGPRRRRSRSSSRPTTAGPTQQALFDWYSTVAREFPSLPIVVYNVPVRTAVDIQPETVGRLRRAHENIVGIKETTRDFEHASYVLNECGRDFLVYCGIELLCYPMLAIGGVGHLSCVANVAPKPCAALYDVFVAGDLEAAMQPPLRPPSARRAGLRRDEPRPDQVDDGAARHPRLRRRQAAARLTAAGEPRPDRGDPRRRRPPRALALRGSRVSAGNRPPPLSADADPRRAAAALRRRRVSSGDQRGATFETLNPTDERADRRRRGGPAADVDARGRCRTRRVRRGAVAEAEAFRARRRPATHRGCDPRQRRRAHRPRDPRHRNADRPDARPRRARRRELRLLRGRDYRSLPATRTRSATSSSTTRSTSRSASPG